MTLLLAALAAFAAFALIGVHGTPATAAQASPVQDPPPQNPPPEPDPCDTVVEAGFLTAGAGACDDQLNVHIGDLVAAARGGGGGAAAGRPKDCATYDAPEGTTPASERQAMPEAQGLEEGKRYYTECFYTDVDPHELAWADFFIYEPGMEGPLLDIVAREIADSMPLTYPVPATAPGIDAEQLVGIDTWLWIDPADWRPVEVDATLAGFTIVVTATPTAVEWDLGERNNERDGDGSVTCDGPGTAWNPAGSDDQRTDCSYNYQWVPEPPETTYPASATIAWEIAYTATGQPGGSLGINATTTDFELTVTERQAVVCYDTPLEDCNP